MGNYKGKLWSSIKISLGRIYYIRWVWKSMVKIEHFKIFMGKNKCSIKVKFLSFSLKYEI